MALSPAELPASVGRIVSRCLEKAREMRFQSARDLAFGLEVLAQTPLTAPSRAYRFGWARHRVLPWAVVASLAVTLAITFYQLPRPRSVQTTTPYRLSVDLGADAALAPFNVQFGNALTISPDGTTLAFVAQRNPDVTPQLYVRRLDEQRAKALPGTEGANAPFFSPDGTWIGFDTGLQVKRSLSRVARRLSWRTKPRSAAPPGMMTPRSCCRLGKRRGLRLTRVPPSGGTPSPLTTLAEGESIHVWPQLLPGGKAVLYTSSRVTSAFNDANLVVQPLPAGTSKVVQRGGYHGLYLRSGHIIYAHDGALYAFPFDADRLELAGPAVRVLDGLASNAITGGVQFSVSDSGTLVYLPGRSLGTGAPLDLVDRAGAYNIAACHARELVYTRVRARRSASGFLHSRRAVRSRRHLGARSGRSATRSRHVRPGIGRETGVDTRRPAYYVRVRPWRSAIGTELVLATG